MAGRDGRRRGPPYVSFRSWETLLDRLHMDVWPLPDRLDSSVWRRLRFSGSTESALKSSLVFLGLTSPDYQPTELLEQLLPASQEERKRVFRTLIANRYISTVLQGVDLTRATRGEVREAFQRAGSGPETSEKSLAFFVSLTQAAGVQLHRQLTMRTPTTRARRSTTPRQRDEKKGRERGETQQTDVSYESNGENSPGPSHVHPALRGLLLELPTTGSGWTEDRKEGFQRAWGAVLDLVHPVVEPPGGL